MSAAGEAQEPNDIASARELLLQAENARRRAGADRGGRAVPLLVLAPMLVVWGLIQLSNSWVVESAMDGQEAASITGWQGIFEDVQYRLYWSYGGAIALMVIGVLLAGRARRVGAGAGAGAWLAAGLGVLVFFQSAGTAFSACFEFGVDYPSCAPPITWLIGAQMLIGGLYGSTVVALALLLVAWRRHDRTLAYCAVLLGVVTGLANVGFVGNRMYELLRSTGVDSSRWTFSWDGLANLLLGAAFAVIGTHLARSSSVKRL